MSRIIVKNLPKKVTEDNLQQLFAQKGRITDIQLKHTPDGIFRQFAFIGYENEKDAMEAIRHFNNTMINTNRIIVEECALLGSKKPRAWSKQSANDSVNSKEQDVENVKIKKLEIGEKNGTEELLNAYKNEPMFEEFLRVHSADDALKILQNKEEYSDGNDSGNDTNDTVEEQDAGESTKHKLANENISDLKYMKSLMSKKNTRLEKKEKEKINLFTIKLNNLPYNCKKADIKQFFRPVVPFSIRIPRNIKGIAFVGFKREIQFSKALLKDKSIIGGKQICVTKYEKKIENTNADKPQNNCWKNQEESLKNEEDIGESGRIFIRNLAYITTEENLQMLFEKYGPIVELNLPLDKITRKLKGFGTVTFLMPEHAVKAYSELDGTILHGRMLHLLPGKPKDAENHEEETTNFKKKKSKQQKAQAGSSHNWNSLFLGHNAVADVIAETYNTTKSVVLDPHGQGAAVRLALGETEIVALTRKYLEDHGVILNAFTEMTTKRSKTIILVKNLPAKTKEKELLLLFQPHGEIKQIIFPPSAITAIIEFVEASEARKAFTKLAYTKFKSIPLYLEWAPDNSIMDIVIQKKKLSKVVGEKDEADCTTNESEFNAICEEEPELNTTLFVKNLNFETTERELRDHFGSCGKIYYASIATKKNTTDISNKLSMGYGFVSFYEKASADKALKSLQQSVLNGKSLELKRSARTLRNEANETRKPRSMLIQTGTKILVRNIPFQANSKEIMDLFKAFGEIKALRLPKKMTVGADSHRGFAFVDYSTNSDAKKAFETLSQSTHLYGRRLVLEWASNGDGVDEIRKRTADHFHTSLEVKSKKSVLNIDDN